MNAEEWNESFRVMPPKCIEKDKTLNRKFTFYLPRGWLKEHEGQAKRNHSQSVDTLHSRGGCSPQEVLAIVNDSKLFGSRWFKMTDAEAIVALREQLEARLRADYPGKE